MESFKSQRATTKSIESLDDIGGWQTLGDLEKESIIEKLEKLPSFGSKSSAAAGSSGTSANNVSKTYTQITHLSPSPM